MKEKYNKYKELKQNPKYNALFKLMGWFIFFIIIGILGRVAGQNEQSTILKENIETKTTYNEMKTNLTNNNIKLKLNIKENLEYYIEGTIIEDIFEGTIEYEDNLYKIMIEDLKLYILTKEEKTLNEEISQNINLNNLFPKNIFELTKGELPIRKELEEDITYNYKIDDKNITIYTNQEEIYKIIILENLIRYELFLEEI